MPSKLAPHALAPSAAVRRMVEAGCPIVKLAGPYGLAEEFLGINPQLLIVGRVIENVDIGGLADSGQSASAQAHALIERQRATYQSNPLIKIWEGPNEPGFGSANDPVQVRRMAWYAAFEAERLRLLADMGLRGVAANFSTGTPDLPLWTAFLPALDACERYQGFLGLHEYSSPFMWSLTGNFQTNNCDGNATGPGEGDTGFTTLRYRKVYRQYLAPNGLDEVPLLITECGLDHIGAVCPGQSSGAWKDHSEYWNRHDGRRDPIDYWRGSERDAGRYYAEQLKWYDAELQKDTFVVGATIFTVGHTSGWEKFEITDTRVTDVLVEHIYASRPPATPPPPPPADPITITPGPEPPRVFPGLNLLVNAGFEEGKAYFADETRERAVPAGWLMEWGASGEPLLPSQSGPFGLPITVLINSRDVAAADRARLFAEGGYAWKVCGLRHPFRVRLWQSLSGLENLRPHRFSASVLADAIERLTPRLAYATNPFASEVRLVVTTHGNVAETDWFTGQTMPFGKYQRLLVDFMPTDGSAVVSLEIRSRLPLPLGAWYVDELRVEPV